MSDEFAAVESDPGHGASIISQSPTKEVGDKVFVSVPGPVQVISLKTKEKRQRTR